MNPLVSALTHHDLVFESETETTTSVPALATTDIENRFLYTLMVLPKTIRVYILTFLGETQEELRELPLVSKQFYKDCKEPGIGWKLHQLFVLSPKENNKDEGRTLNFIHTMN